MEQLKNQVIVRIDDRPSEVGPTSRSISRRCEHIFRLVGSPGTWSDKGSIERCRISTSVGSCKRPAAHPRQAELARLSAT
jgi:hypothetical protein